MKPKKKTDNTENIFSKLIGNNNKKIVIILILSYFLTFFFIVMITQRAILFPKDVEYKLGVAAPEDFIVDRNFTYIDEIKTAKKREERAQSVPPVFYLTEEIARNSIEEFKIFEEAVTNIRSTREIERVFDELQFQIPDLKENLNLNDMLLFVEYEGTERILSGAYNLLYELMYKQGMFVETLRRSISQSKSSYVELLGKGDVLINDIITINTLEDWVLNNPELRDFDETGKYLIYILIKTFADEDCFYDEEGTEAKKRKARDEVSEIEITLYKGQPIVEKGEIVTEEILNKITEHGETKISININNIIGTGVLLLIILAISVLVLDSRIWNIYLENNQKYFLIISSLTYIVTITLLTLIPWEKEALPFSILIPTSVFTVFITILVSNRTGIIFSFIFSLFVLMIELVMKLETPEMDMHAFIFVLFSGIAGSAVVQGAGKRMHLIRAGLYLALLNSVFLIILYLFKNHKSAVFFSANIFTSNYLSAVIWGSVNGFVCGILILGFLPILEYMLNAPTQFRLMELSDLNSPILKKMLSLAPGTYSHSISVANLAESACTEIGANALLARVGAYYHDIGKIEQAKYFIENQWEANRHDDLKPNLSAAVIKSHLKIGIEKAKELRLPKKVLDIVAQHHGKGLIAYFYHRAVQESNGSSKNNKISLDDYRYSGERPASKEAAVVLLADTVEAASRTIKKPTIAKLEKFVWTIIMEKFESEELSNSNLTLNDLEKIKQSFVHVLAGYFHSRIEYPGKNGAAN
jgi:cyclic-di-AMP phosphodiesterase PgpH